MPAARADQLGASRCLPAALLIAAALAAGCEPKPPAKCLLGPDAGVAAFQEVPVRLDRYESPQRRAGQDGSLALTVAISGGGLRSANFALGVLLALEEIVPDKPAGRNALGEIDYFSTVSGGGFAAGAYVTSRADYRRFGGRDGGYCFRAAIYPADAPPGEQFTDPELRRHFRHNYESKVIRGALAPTAHRGLDRGDYLEDALDQNILGRRWRARRLEAAGADAAGASLTLRDVFVRRGSGRPVRLPYWVANATVYENGAMFPFTPDHLALHEVTGYVHGLETVTDDRLPARRRADHYAFAENVPFALGLRASSSFPVLIAAATLKSDMDERYPYIHLLDGGLADNLGATTALRLLRDEKHAGVVRKSLIVVDAFRDAVTPFSDERTQPRPVATARRVMEAHVDSARGRSREILRALCRSEDFCGKLFEPGSVDRIGLVFLSFDDLRDLTHTDLTTLATSAGLTPADLESLGADDETVTPFELARSIPSSLKLAEPQQKLLIALGRYVVAGKREQILQALGWEVPGP